MKRVWTVLCSFPDSPRGQYDEEIDVESETPGKARKKAEALLKTGYDPGLRVRKVVRATEISIFHID
jgi:hypothetical protein